VKQARISIRQCARIVYRWAFEIGPDPSDFSTDSMRRTKATWNYRKTKNLHAVRLLLGHTKLKSTLRYLGVEVEDVLKISEQTKS
jgi:integrase